MKPMLAATAKDLITIRYPIYASPKLDGVRGLVIDGVLHSRALKLIPNGFVSTRFSSKALSGLDGELILGSPTAKDVYRVTQSACSSPDGEPDVKFYVFDVHDSKLPYEKRLLDLVTRADDLGKDVVVLGSKFIRNEVELLAEEEMCLDIGYEGLILRSPGGAYKFGRSTEKQQGMLKLKRFTDGEFLLLDVEEEMENKNAAKTNALGRTERSSHQAGMVGKGRAGTLCARETKTLVEFRIGTGMDDKDKAWFWKHRKKLKGKFVGKYKSFLIGVKDKPRFPVYLGPRDKWDI